MKRRRESGRDSTDTRHDTYPLSLDIPVYVYNIGFGDDKIQMTFYLVFKQLSVKILVNESQKCKTYIIVK